MVNSLPVNEDPNNEGVPPRADPNGYWVPPIYGTGYSAQVAGQLYRWSNGEVSAAGSNYQLYEGNWWGPGPVQLTYYRSATTFYCNPWSQFSTFDGDPSIFENIEVAPFPRNRWYPLAFHHEEGLSRVDFVGEGQSLAAPSRGAGWVNQLGLLSYEGQDPEAPGLQGLGGNLALLIALVAFSCRSGDLNTVLLGDRAWRHYNWRGHHRPHGRKCIHIKCLTLASAVIDYVAGQDRRGKVVTIYLDPENPQGSTQTTLHELEWTSGAVLR